MKNLTKSINIDRIQIYLCLCHTLIEGACTQSLPAPWRAFLHHSWCYVIKPPPLLHKILLANRNFNFATFPFKLSSLYLVVCRSASLLLYIFSISFHHFHKKQKKAMKLLYIKMLIDKHLDAQWYFTEKYKSLLIFQRFSDCHLMCKCVQKKLNWYGSITGLGTKSIVGCRELMASFEAFCRIYSVGDLKTPSFLDSFWVLVLQRWLVCQFREYWHSSSICQ